MASSAYSNPDARGMEVYRDPQVGTPRSGRYRFGELPSVGAAMARAGQALAEAAAHQEKLDEKKQDAADSNEAFKILNETELAIAESMSGLDKEGLGYDVYRTRGQELVTEHVTKAEERINALKTERVRVYAGHQLGNSATRHTISVFGESDKRFVDQDRAETASQRQTLVNLAINAPDDASFAQHRQRLTDFLGSKAGLTLSKVEAEKQLTHDLKTISEERLKAQIRRNPDKVEDLLGMAAGQTMPENEKDGIREYAAAVQRKRAEDVARLEAAAAKVFKAGAERVEIEVHELARKKQITKDGIAEIALRNRGPQGEPVFTAERVATLQKRLEDTDTVVSDPEFMRQLRLGVQNATTTPQFRSLQAQVDSAYRRDKVSGTDYDHLQARIRQYMKSTEDENKVTYREAHDQVLKEMNALFRIEPGVPIKMFDERAQAYERTLRELNKESAFREGARDPRQWWDENRIRAAGQVRDILEKQIELGRRQFPPQIQTIWEQGKVDPRTRAASAAQALERMKSTIAPAEYMRLRNIVKEQRDMEVEFVRIDAMQPIFGAGSGTNARGRN